MALRFRRSFKIAPGVRLSVSKSGLGVSAGVRGARVGVNSRGTYTSVSIPGTGLSDVTYHGKGASSRKATGNAVPVVNTGEPQPKSRLVWVVGISIVFLFINPIVAIFVFAIGFALNHAVTKGRTVRPAQLSSDAVPTPAVASKPVETGVVEAPTVSTDNSSEDFKKLLSIHRKHKRENFQMNVEALLKEMFPDATENTCPYCKTVHEFKAVRARKCPTCSEKMVVRQGHFLTEGQVEALEARVASEWQIVNDAHDLGRALKAAQDSKVYDSQDDYLKYLAEAYRHAAKLENQRDAKGLSFWDKSWSYYNQARNEGMKTLSKDMMEYSSLPSLLWEMSQMLVDQAKSSSESSAVRTKKQAIQYACMSLAEAAKFGAEPYFRTNVYKEVKDMVAQLALLPEEVTAITETAAAPMRLTPSQATVYQVWLRELNEYELIH